MTRSGTAWLARATGDARRGADMYSDRMFGAVRFTRITRPAA